MLTILRTALSISAAIMMAMGTSAICAQGYPTKPIRIVTSLPGNFLDYTARLIAEGISGPLGQPVIVDNRATTVYLDVVLQSPHDGYTVALGANDVWLTPLAQKTSYDAVKDFSPITTAVTLPFVLVVHPSVPAKSVKELIDLAKAKPGTLNIASSTVPGTASWNGAELFKAMSGANIVAVPYKSGALGSIGVISGEVQMMFLNVSQSLTNIKAGKLRGLAVTSQQPTALAPGMPALAATLPGFELSLIGGVFAPAGTPAANINRLNQEILRVLGRADVKEKLITQAAEPLGNTPAQFAALIKTDLAKWGKLFKDIGVKPQ